jgi:hypothetical protein
MNLGLLKKLEYLIEKKIIPNVLFNEIILDGMSLDSSKVEIFDLSIILHVYYKLTQANLTGKQNMLNFILLLINF